MGGGRSRCVSCLSTCLSVYLRGSVHCQTWWRHMPNYSLAVIGFVRCSRLRLLPPAWRSTAQGLGEGGRGLDGAALAAAAVLGCGDVDGGVRWPAPPWGG